MALSPKDKLAKAYAGLAKKLSRLPTRNELKKAGISRDQLRHHFGTLDEAAVYSKSLFPENFNDIIDLSLFNDSVYNDQRELVKNYRRFFITTAVAGAPVHREFLESIKTYCRDQKAAMLLIPANYALQEMSADLVSDPEIHLVFRTLKLNSNISVNPIKIDPKQVDPVVGLDAFGHSETTIIGSPKQRRVPIANSNSKLARIIQATGAVTKPAYIPRDGAPKRRDTLATAHHVMGGVIVEIVDNKFYHMRHVEMCKDGSFNDLFMNYSSESIEFVGCAAIIKGDTHVGDTDPVVSAVVDEMIKLGKPTYWMEHDFFNGKSISHHSVQNQVYRAKLALEGKISFYQELKATYEELVRGRKLNTGAVRVIVESNHNDWIIQYLNKGDFNDMDRLVAIQLQAYAIQGLHPLRAAMEKVFGLKPGPDIRWLGIDEDFRVSGVELGAHGHLGANGKRNPGAKGMYKTYGKCMFGHGHHGEIWHGAMMVGTSTYLKLDYNQGGSNWDNSQGILYRDGTRQIVNIIAGKWRLAV